MSPTAYDTSPPLGSCRSEDRFEARPTSAPDGPSAPPALRADPVGILVLVCALGYMLTWWNRYLSPTVGFELMFADEYVRGHLPYRDYYFPVQPGWVLASIAGVKLFGARLIGFWFLGIVARTLSAWLTYRLLTRLCPPAWAGWATLVAFVASCGDIADFPAWYNYLTAAFATYVAFTAVRCVEADEGLGRWTWAILTGLALALEFLTKQTSGILVGLAATVSLFLALSWRYGPRRAGADLLTVLVSASVPCLLVAGWLVANGAWPDYLDQVYVKGPSSKGGLGGSLLRLRRLALGSRELRAAILLASWITAGAVGLRAIPPAGRGGDSRGPSHRDRRAFGAGVLLVLIGITAGFCYLDTRNLPLAGCALGLVGSLALALLALSRALRGGRDLPTLVLGVAGGISFASSFALSLSWPLFEPMIWPALALAFAAFWRSLRGPVQHRRVQVFAVAVGVLLIGCSGWRKYREPMSWGYWVEPPVSVAAREPALPRLAGFRLSPSSSRFYEQVTALVRRHSRPDEPILVFPHMPLLYGLAERPLATFAYMHYPDVCPDYVAEADAERLRRRPPAMIIWFDFPETEWALIEKDFRKSESSGQRKLQAVMRQLVGRDYAKVGEFPVRGFVDSEGKPRLFIRVWARRK